MNVMLIFAMEYSWTALAGACLLRIIKKRKNNERGDDYSDHPCSTRRLHRRINRQPDLDDPNMEEREMTDKSIRMEVTIAVHTPGTTLIRCMNFTGDDKHPDSDVFRWGIKTLVDQTTDMLRVKERREGEPDDKPRS